MISACLAICCLGDIKIATAISVVDSITAGNALHYRSYVDYVDSCVNEGNVPALYDDWFKGSNDDGVNMSLYANFDAAIDRSRSAVATQFLDEPNRTGDVLVFIDYDIMFDAPTLHQLIKDCYATKSIVVGPYAIKNEKVPPDICVNLLKGNSLKLRTGKPELLEVRYGGTGFMAIHIDVLRKMAETMETVECGSNFYPFFLPITVDGKYLSEDFSFCYKARELGFKVWCDPNLWLGHVGAKIFENFPKT